MTDRLRAQYEALPYPARDPADERRRLVTGSPSHLDEIVHYVFGGRRRTGHPWRVLFAGGGTGDGTIMLAQQLADAGVAGRITYLDLSDAARRVAQARAQARGLGNLDFHGGSLLDLADPARVAALGGPFDYIDCCGVVHHLDDPAAGMAALAGALAPGGGIGLMVYAPYGRTGVYPLQEALRPLCAGRDVGEQVAIARRLLRHLPASNWFRLNRYLTDHQQSDAGLYDLLLHSCDRAYPVGELAALVAGAGLAITALIEPARYHPASYLPDPHLLARLGRLPWLEQAAWAERISGAINKHIAYLVRAGDADAAVAQPDDPGVIPLLRGIDGAGLAANLPAGGGSLNADLHGSTLSIRLPPLAAALLGRIDGRCSLAELHAECSGSGPVLSWEHFKAEFDQLYHGLNGINAMLLRRP